MTNIQHSPNKDSGFLFLLLNFVPNKVCETHILENFPKKQFHFLGERRRQEKLMNAACYVGLFVCLFVCFSWTSSMHPSVLLKWMLLRPILSMWRFVMLNLILSLLC